MMDTIYVYGGSFNPWGFHHTEAVAWLQAALPTLDSWVIVVPAMTHPNKDLTYCQERLDMARAVTADMGFPRVGVMDLEGNMLREGWPAPIMTYDLLARVDQRNPEHKVRFAVGEDLLVQLPTWDRYEETMRDFGFVLVPEVKAPHATEIRRMIAACDPTWRLHVPEPAQRVIDRGGLYR